MGLRRATTPAKQNWVSRMTTSRTRTTMTTRTSVRMTEAASPV